MKKKDKKIGSPGDYLGWAITTNRGPIIFDSSGEWWLGGNEPFLAIAVFGHRVDAIKIAKRIKKQRPDLILWTKTWAVRFAEVG